jgi:hypothetical protein
MAFNVNTFRSVMKGDGARPNLFQCVINPPPGIQTGLNSNELSFMARAAQLPGSTVNQVPVMYFGRELKFAGNRIFQDWTVTIINDENFSMRNAFERWMSGLNSHLQNTRTASALSPLDYTAEGQIYQYGKVGDTVLKAYRFVGMFPVDVSPIEVDWGANDTIEEFAVTFAYQWWEDLSVSGESAPTTDGPST